MVVVVVVCVGWPPSASAGKVAFVIKTDAKAANHRMAVFGFIAFLSLLVHG
jgi:hypothetical protein